MTSKRNTNGNPKGKSKNKSKPEIEIEFEPETDCGIDHDAAKSDSSSPEEPSGAEFEIDNFMRALEALAASLETLPTNLDTDTASRKAIQSLFDVDRSDVHVPYGSPLEAYENHTEGSLKAATHFDVCYNTTILVYPTAPGESLRVRILQNTTFGQPDYVISAASASKGVDPRNIFNSALSLITYNDRTPYSMDPSTFDGLMDLFPKLLLSTKEDAKTLRMALEAQYQTTKEMHDAEFFPYIDPFTEAAFIRLVFMPFPNNGEIVGVNDRTYKKFDSVFAVPMHLVNTEKSRRSLEQMRTLREFENNWQEEVVMLLKTCLNHKKQTKMTLKEQEEYWNSPQSQS